MTFGKGPMFKSKTLSLDVTAPSHNQNPRQQALYEAQPLVPHPPGARGQRPPKGLEGNDLSESTAKRVRAEVSSSSVAHPRAIPCISLIFLTVPTMAR